MTGQRNGLPLAVVGCDFRVASSSRRSRLVLERDEALRIASELRTCLATDGFVDLNTCNRNEWVVSSRDPRWAAEILRTQMVARAGTDDEGRRVEPYVHVGEDAARHVFRVAIGRESLVVGERQIAGQIHAALETARARGTSSRILNGMGTVAGRLVRVAHRRGCLGGAGAGVHTLAVRYVSEHLPRNAPARVAVVGLGSIGRRVLATLSHDPRFTAVPVNRTVRDEWKQKVRPLAELASVLAEVDAAVVCTGAPRPVLRARELAALPAGRSPLVVDIGIPEQVERAESPGPARVAGLDELTEFHRRRGGADPAGGREDVEQLLDRAMEEFRLFCNGATFARLLDTVQHHHDQLVQEEIPRLVDTRFGYLTEEARATLEHDLRGIVLGYTSEVFRTIKETSLRHDEGDT